jgi:hypothetical protein
MKRAAPATVTSEIAIAIIPAALISGERAELTDAVNYDESELNGL